MKLIRLYMRVLGALHREARLAWILAVANLAWRRPSLPNRFYSDA